MSHCVTNSAKARATQVVVMRSSNTDVMAARDTELALNDNSKPILSRATVHV